MPGLFVWLAARGSPGKTARDAAWLRNSPRVGGVGRSRRLERAYGAWGVRSGVEALQEFWGGSAFGRSLAFGF